jgi:hypothetical protein
MLRKCGATGRVPGKVPPTLIPHDSAGTLSTGFWLIHARMLGEASGGNVQRTEVSLLWKARAKVLGGAKAFSV